MLSDTTVYALLGVACSILGFNALFVVLYLMGWINVHVPDSPKPRVLWIGKLAGTVSTRLHGIYEPVATYRDEEESADPLFHERTNDTTSNKVLASKLTMPRPSANLSRGSSLDVMPPSPRWRGSEAFPSPSIVRQSPRHAIPQAVKPLRWAPRGVVGHQRGPPRAPPGSNSKSSDGVSRTSLISTLPPSYHTRGSIIQDAGAIPLYSPPISGQAAPPSAFTDGYGQEGLRSGDPRGGLESPTAQTSRTSLI
ncbi:hypothetical protein C8Q74DRAFT_983567 [Fomes fomentarius]|nr:hypothetical protein C8Q74DRAFT_983567 [Fomes fomentarius]